MYTSGPDHIVFTIAQVERSRAFYSDILGFTTRIMPPPYKGFYFVLGGIDYFFIQPSQLIEGDRFDEARIGLDHLSFSVPDKETLHIIAEKLMAAGVETKGVEQFTPTGNWYVALRDPDNIQLEYWVPTPRQP